MTRNLTEEVRLPRYSNRSSLRISAKGADSHSRATGVDWVAESSAYRCSGTRPSPAPCRPGIILHAELNGRGSVAWGRRTLIGTLVLLFLFCLSPIPAFAHRVYLYAWVEGDTVYTESYFSGGVKVKNGLIQVFDTAGKELLQGRTDDKGEFSFRIPEKTDLRIVINASMGHRGEFTVKADELGGETPPPETEKEQPPKVTKTEFRSPVQIDTDQIRKIVDEAMDSKLKPIARSIARLQERTGPGFTEIIGGVGYLFGIMGLLLYLRDRKRRGK